MATEYRLSYTAQEIDERLRKTDELEHKQDKLTFDSVPTEGSENLVKSGDIYTAIQNATPNLTFDEAPTEGSENLVKSGAIHAALQNVGGTDLVAGDLLEIKDGVVRCTLGDVISEELKEEFEEIYGTHTLEMGGEEGLYMTQIPMNEYGLPSVGDILEVVFTPSGETTPANFTVETVPFMVEDGEVYIWSAGCNATCTLEMEFTVIDDTKPAIFLAFTYDDGDLDAPAMMLVSSTDYTGATLTVGTKTITEKKEYVLLPDTALGLGREIVTEVNEEIFSAENIVEEDYGNGRYCLEYDLSSNPSNKFPSPNGKLTIEFDLSDGTKKTFVVDVEHHDEGSEQIYEAYYNCAYVGADGKEELMKTDENSDALYFNFYHYSGDEPETYLTIVTWADYSGASITIKNSAVTKTRITLPNEALNFDSKPTKGSTNLVNSGNIYTAIQNATPNLEYDPYPVQYSSNLVRSGDIYDAIQNAKPNLTYDTTPTQGSTNLVNSGNIYTAIQNAKPNLTYDNAPTKNSKNLVTSGTIYDVIGDIDAVISEINSLIGGDA